MTTVEPVPIITVLTGTTEGSRTMMDYETILAMKALHEQGHSAMRIAKLLGCGRNTVLRHMRNDFARPQREAPPRSLDEHQDFLLARFLRHPGNADVVRQELAEELGIEDSIRTVQRAVKPYRERLRAARLATQRYETRPEKQLQIVVASRGSKRRGCAGIQSVSVTTFTSDSNPPPELPIHTQG